MSMKCGFDRHLTITAMIHIHIVIKFVMVRLEAVSLMLVCCHCKYCINSVMTKHKRQQFFVSITYVRIVMSHRQRLRVTGAIS